jgi:hypothetical protein
MSTLSLFLEIRMIIEILSHIPRWVFALFFGLLYYGYMQTKTREISVTRLVIMPVAMLALSFSGVWNTFGASILAIGCWFGAYALGAATAVSWVNVKGVKYSAETRLFTLPGSWLPLALMMAIFFTKFVVGMNLAQHPEFLEQTRFIAIAGMAFGIFSGMFLGRMLKIARTHGKHAIRSMLAA